MGLLPGGDRVWNSSFTIPGATPLFIHFWLRPAGRDVKFAGQSLESLVVANSGDGLFTLLGGTEGLELEQTLSSPYLSQPSALVLAALSGDEVSFYATTAGVEAAFTLAFI